MKALIAVIALVVSGCASAQTEIVLPNGASFKGDGMAAAVFAWGYWETQKAPVQQAGVDCTQHTTAGGAEECERRLAQSELVSNLAGGKDEQSVPVAMMQIQAQKDMNARNNWFGLANVVTGGLFGYLNADLAYDAQVASDRELYKTFRTFAQNGGTNTYKFKEAEIGGDLTVTAIGRDGMVAGNDIGQGSVGGDLIGRDNAPVADSDGVIGGVPNITCGGPGEITSCPVVEPSDPDTVTSSNDLL